MTITIGKTKPVSDTGLPFMVQEVHPVSDTGLSLGRLKPHLALRKTYLRQKFRIFTCIRFSHVVSSRVCLIYIYLFNGPVWRSPGSSWLQHPIRCFIGVRYFVSWSHHDVNKRHGGSSDRWIYTMRIIYQTCSPIANPRIGQTWKRRTQTQTCIILATQQL